MPSLGLSNKAVFKENEKPNEQRHIKDEYPENYFSAVTLNGKKFISFLSFITEVVPCNRCIFVNFYISRTATGGNINAKYTVARSSKTLRTRL